MPCNYPLYSAMQGHCFLPLYILRNIARANLTSKGISLRKRIVLRRDMACYATKRLKTGYNTRFLLCILLCNAIATQIQRVDAKGCDV